MTVVVSSLDAAVEDLTPSSSLSSPIRWISLTFMNSLGFDLLFFEQQGRHIPRFRPSLFKVPLFHHFFFFLIVSLTSCLAPVVHQIGRGQKQKEKSPSLVQPFTVCFFVSLFLIIMKNE